MIEKVVYISHEFGGKQENADRVTKLVTELTLLYPEICFISPIHTFGFMYFETEYEQGIELCLTLLDMSDELWVFGECSNSRGCLIEKQYAKDHKIPIIEKG